MDARILSFRRGRHTQTTNQFLVEVEGIDSKEKTKKIIGKKLVWKSPAGKKIIGTITHPHGNSGVVRTRFNKGLPGTAIGNKVEFLKCVALTGAAASSKAIVPKYATTAK